MKFPSDQIVYDVMQGVISNFLEVLYLLNTLFLEPLDPIVVSKYMLFQLLLKIWELDQDLLVIILVKHG